MQRSAKVMWWSGEGKGAWQCMFRWSLLKYLVDLHHGLPRLWMESGLEGMAVGCGGGGGGGYGGGGARAELQR